MRPFERGSMPAFIAFMYSMFMSFTVGAESFIVNCGCCATALVASTVAASARPMVFIALLLRKASGDYARLLRQEKPHAGQRYLRHVGDKEQRDEIQDDERDDAAIDHVELELQRRLRDEDVDAEGRVEEPDRA